MVPVDGGSARDLRVAGITAHQRGSSPAFAPPPTGLTLARRIPSRVFSRGREKEIHLPGACARALALRAVWAGRHGRLGSLRRAVHHRSQGGHELCVTSPLQSTGSGRRHSPPILSRITTSSSGVPAHSARDLREMNRRRLRVRQRRRDGTQAGIGIALHIGIGLRHRDGLCLRGQAPS
jgi:hypothetical protein